MTETILSLIPEYGLIVVFVVVTIAGLGMPVPSSLVVLASGGFAATGDLVLWQVLSVVYVAVFVGDQLGYAGGKMSGAIVISKVKTLSRSKKLVDRAQNLLEKRQGVAILLGHTVLSPICPYINYLSGAGRIKWSTFTSIALFGASIWTTTYVVLGYLFASNLALISELAGNVIGIIIAGIIVILGVVFLRNKWINTHPK